MNIERLNAAYDGATDKQREAIKAYGKEGSLRKAAQSLDKDHSTVKGLLISALRKLDRQLASHKSPQGFEAVKVSTNGKGEITAVKHRPIPSEDVPAPPDHLIKGVSTLYDATGEVSARWVKTQKGEQQKYESFLDATARHVAQYDGAAGVSKTPEKVNHADTCAFYGLGDMHVGLLSWAAETGHNMDLKIIGKLGREATERLVDRTLPSEEAYMVNVGDFFHADDRTQTTPGGKNALDVDGRFDRVAEVGLNLMRDMVRTLKTKHSKVHIVNAKGNHDPHMTPHLVGFLRAIFSNDDSVIVHPCTLPLQTFKFGKNLVGVTHSDGLKPDKIPEVMAIQCRKQWADVEYCWAMTGHIHHKQKTFEKGGVVVESFNTLGVPDYWHAAHGFVGAGRWFESVTLTRDGGEIARARVSVNSKNLLV